MEHTTDPSCPPLLIPILPGIHIPPTPRPIIELPLHGHRKSSLSDSPLLPEEDGNSAINIDDLTATEEPTGPTNSSIVSLPESELPMGEEYLVDDRLQFLFDDPILLQDAVCEEKGRASSDELDLKIYQTSRRIFQVITFDRLRRIYNADLLSIRLDSNTLHVFVTSPTDASRFASSSTEISQISSERTDVPPIVTELLSALDVTDDAIRYIYLLYDTVNDYWELIGVLDSSPVEDASQKSQTATENLPTEETEVDRSNCSGGLPQSGEKKKNQKKKNLQHVDKDCMVDGRLSTEQIPAIDLLPNVPAEVSVSRVNRFDWFTNQICSNY